MDIATITEVASRDTTVIAYVDSLDHHTKFSEAEAVQAFINTVATDQIVSGDFVYFNDITDNSMKKENLADLDENVLTGMKSYVDGLDHHSIFSPAGIDGHTDVIFGAGGALASGDIMTLDGSNVWRNVPHGNVANTHHDQTTAESLDDDVSAEAIYSGRVGASEQFLGLLGGTGISTSSDGKQVTITNTGHTTHSRVTTDANIVDAVEAVGDATPVSTDKINFIDNGILKKVLLSSLTSAMLTGLDSGDDFDPQNMVQSANKRWVLLGYWASGVAGDTRGTNRSIVNNSGTDTSQNFQLSGMPYRIFDTDGTTVLTLHMTEARIYIHDADANDRVILVRVFGNKTDGTESLLWTSGTVSLITTGLKNSGDELASMGDIDIGTAYDQVAMIVGVQYTSSGGLDFGLCALQVWYE